MEQHKKYFSLKSYKNVVEKLAPDPSLFSKTSKSSISLDQQSYVLCTLFFLYVQVEGYRDTKLWNSDLSFISSFYLWIDSLKFIQFVYLYANLKVIERYWNQAAGYLLLPHMKLFKNQKRSLELAFLFFAIFEKNFFSHLSFC